MNLSFGIGSNAGQGSNPIKITGTCEFNFINEDDSVVITILNPDISSIGFITFSYLPIATTETSLDDFKLNGVTVQMENIVNNVSFDLRAIAQNNASGKYVVNYYIES